MIIWIFILISLSLGCVFPVCKNRSNCPVPQTEDPDLFDDVCMHGGYQRAGTGKYSRYNSSDADGLFICSCCGNILFDAGDRFDSGCDWPSFIKPFNGSSIETRDDTSCHMCGHRVAVDCHKCGLQIGYVFNDGPPGFKRYTLNSVCLHYLSNQTSHELPVDELWKEFWTDFGLSAGVGTALFVFIIFIFLVKGCAVAQIRAWSSSMSYDRDTKN